MVEARRVLGAVGAFVCLLAPLVAGCASGPSPARPAASAPAAVARPPAPPPPAPKVAVVIALSPVITFGKPADHPRAERRMGDALIEASGGHAILAEELPPGPASLDDGALSAAVRALGEDPARALTFAVTASRSDRSEALELGGTRRSSRAVRRYHDYTVRIEVRRCEGGRAVLGTVETFASAMAGEPELDARGRPRGLQIAIGEALAKALRAYAPDLDRGEPFPKVIEAPALPPSERGRRVGTRAALERLKKIQAIYPEASTDDLASLSSSRARLLVLEPGRLAALGLQRGDLVSGTGAQPLGGGASLARALARGETPALGIDRGRTHFVLGRPVVARRK
jgi:hypothetical protein